MDPDRKEQLAFIESEMVDKHNIEGVRPMFVLSFDDYDESSNGGNNEYFEEIDVGAENNFNGQSSEDHEHMEHHGHEEHNEHGEHHDHEHMETHEHDEHNEHGDHHEYDEHDHHGHHHMEGRNYYQASDIATFICSLAELTWVETANFRTIS